MATPASTFLNAFQAADNSARAWANQQLQQQQFYQNLARTAVAAEKERKAQDFNEMMDMLKRNDQNYQFDQSEQRLRDGQNIQAALGGYNAQTSRMGAVTSRINQQLDARRLAQSQSFNNDPYGLMGGDGYQEPALPQLDVPSIQDPSGNLFDFNGNGRITSYGYANDPTPDSNSAAGIGAFVPTSEQEKIRRGEASDFRLRPGDLAVSPDLEAVFRRANIKPGTDVTLQYNDGSTHTGRWMDRTAREYNGKPLTGRFDIYSPDGVNPRDGMPARLLLPDNPEQALPVATEPPILAAPEALPAFNSASAASVQAPSALAVEPTLPSPESRVLPDIGPDSASPLLPPPSQGYPSFSGNDLSGEMSRQLTMLRRGTEALNLQELQAKQQAMQIQRLIPKLPTAGARSVYRNRAQELNAISQQAGIQAAEAEAARSKLEKDMALVQKRQDAVGALSVLDGVLPDAEVRGIIEEASNPTTGGAADQKIKALQEYNTVRDQHGLGYISRGLITAQEVARTGKLLDTPEAKKAQNAFDQYEVYKAESADPNLDERTKAKFRDKLTGLKAGAERWREMKSNFDRAVRMDMRPVPVMQDMEGEATAAQDNGVPVNDLKAQADALRGQRSGMPIEEQRRWSDAKDTLYGFLGGDSGLVSKMADWTEIRSLAEMKNFIRRQLVADVAAKSEDPAASEMTEVGASAVGLSRLPMNAKSVTDVADALAEDIWTKKMGRPAKGAVQSDEPPISEKGRKVWDSVPNFTP